MISDGNKESGMALSQDTGASKTYETMLRIIEEHPNFHPHGEQILGDMRQEVLRFWLHLEGMTPEQMKAVSDISFSAVGDDEWDDARQIARNAASPPATAAYQALADVFEWRFAIAAGLATDEIRGIRNLREHGHQPFFLPMFGFDAAP